MALWQGLSTRKKTGGRLRLSRSKRRFEIGREVHLPILGETSRRTYRTRGGQQKVRILAAKTINVTDPAKGTAKHVEFTTVLENPANPHYVRRNIISRGALVQTSLGAVRVTSRPGQHGVLNGTLET